MGTAAQRAEHVKPFVSSGSRLFTRRMLVKVRFVVHFDSTCRYLECTWPGSTIVTGRSRGASDGRELAAVEFDPRNVTADFFSDAALFSLAAPPFCWPSIGGGDGVFIDSGSLPTTAVFNDFESSDVVLFDS